MDQNGGLPIPVHETCRGTHGAREHIELKLAAVRLYTRRVREMPSITLTTAARGFHYYKKSWKPTLGELLEVRSVHEGGGGGITEV